MIIVTFWELINNIMQYFDKVEEGETIQINRYGKPIATIIPYKSKGISRWHLSSPLEIPGISLSKAILEERGR